MQMSKEQQKRVDKLPRNYRRCIELLHNIAYNKYVFCGNKESIRKFLTELFQGEL